MDDQGPPAADRPAPGSQTSRAADPPAPDAPTPPAAGPPAPDAREAAARLFEEAAAELDRAAAHCRRAAEHFRGGQVPSATAHGWAALGHLREAELGLEAQARAHRLRSSV
jgi:hypothetical protein